MVRRARSLATHIKRSTCLFGWLGRAASPVAHSYANENLIISLTPSLSAKPTSPSTHAHVRAPISPLCMGRRGQVWACHTRHTREHCVRHTVWASTSHSHSHIVTAKETSHPHTVARCFESFSFRSTHTNPSNTRIHKHDPSSVGGFSWYWTHSSPFWSSGESQWIQFLLQIYLRWRLEKCKLIVCRAVITLVESSAIW